VPLPRWLARSNRRLANPLLAPAAGRLPYFAIVVHRGRRSGGRYRTPVNAFPDDDGFVFALTYGPGTDWAENLLAAGTCEIIHRGRRIALVEPRLVHGGPPRAIPALVRAALRTLGVSTFLRMRTRGADPRGQENEIRRGG
jgi:deazaflavin-dependent oxidoreductase (nitroreductase family)